MPTSNIGESDVIGLSGDLKKKEERGEDLDEKRSGENRLVPIETYPVKPKHSS